MEIFYEYMTGKIKFEVYAQKFMKVHTPEVIIFEVYFYYRCHIVLRIRYVTLIKHPYITRLLSLPFRGVCYFVGFDRRAK